MEHINSHIVSIHRLGTFLSRAQAKSSSTFFGSNKESIGGYFDKETSHKIGSGMTFEEEAILLPRIIDVPADDRDFRKKVTEFFNDLNTPVPENGVELEIGLTKDNNLPLCADKNNENLPINIMDYIRYRHAKGHPWTSMTKEGGEGNQTKHFYIFDKEQVAKRKTSINKEKDVAMEVFLKVKQDDKLIDQMLILMGIDVRTFGKLKEADQAGAKLEKLRELAETKPTDFKKTYDAGELEVRAWINAMITTGILKQIGKKIVDAEDTSVEIGNNIDEAVFYFKDDDNSGTVTALKSRLQEANLTIPAEGSRKTVVEA